MDEDGNIIKAITYDSFGNIISDTNPSLEIAFGFAGGLYDHDTKLNRFGYRDYDAHAGKWTSKDPIGLAGGDSNVLAYVGGDPVNFVDPTGEIWWWAVGALVGSGFEIYNQISQNGWNGLGNLNWGNIAFAGIAGGASGLGSTFFKAIGYGAFSGGANKLYQELNDCDKVEDWKAIKDSVLDSAQQGAIGAGIGYIPGSVGSNILRNPNQRYLRNFIPGAFPNQPNYGTLGGLTGAGIGGYYGN